jgi:hypothetical protein
MVFLIMYKYLPVKFAVNWNVLNSKKKPPKKYKEMTHIIFKVIKIILIFIEFLQG